jgi:hypothetical protein
LAITSSFFWTSPCVFLAQAAQNLAQRALGHGMADGLARAGHRFDQQAQFARQGVFLALLLDQEARQCGVSGHKEALCREKGRAVIRAACRQPPGHGPGWRRRDLAGRGTYPCIKHELLDGLKNDHLRAGNDRLARGLCGFDKRRVGGQGHHVEGGVAGFDPVEGKARSALADPSMPMG